MVKTKNSFFKKAGVELIKIAFEDFVVETKSNKAKKFLEQFHTETQKGIITEAKKIVNQLKK